MRVASRQRSLALLLLVGLAMAQAAPAGAAVGAIRIEGADRYATSAETALNTC